MRDEDRVEMEVGQKLEESEQRYAALFDHSPLAVALTRMPEGTTVAVNDAFLALFEFSRQEVLGRTSFELGIADNESRKEVAQALERHGAVRGYECKRVTRTGKVLYVSLSLDWAEIRGEKHMLTIIQDITEREKLKERLENVARFPDENPHPILRVTAEGALAYANASSSAILKAWQCSLGQVVPKEWAEIVERALGSGETRTLDLSVEDRVYSFTIVPVLAGPYVNLYGRDITEQKQMEAELYRAERDKAEFLGSIEDPFYGLDSEWRYTIINEKAAAFIGKSQEELLGRNIWELFPQARGSESERQLRKAMEERIPVHFEVRSVIKRAWTDVHIFPKADGGISVLYRDITERKQVEERLRESEARFRTMANSTPVIIWGTDARGETEFVNRAYEEFFGVSEAEVKPPSTWTVLIHPEDKEHCVGSFMKAVEDRTSYTMEARVRHCSGGWRWLRTVATPRFDSEGVFLGHVGSSTDITEEKRAVDALKASELNFRLMVNQSHGAMLVVGSDGTIEALSESATDLLGYTEGELLGKNVNEMAVTMSRLEIILALDDLRKQAPRPKEMPLRVKTKTGEPQFMSVTASILNLGTQSEKYFIRVQRLSLPAAKKP
jgi:PAS domain S-box-containing protein